MQNTNNVQNNNKPNLNMKVAVENKESMWINIGIVAAALVLIVFVWMSFKPKIDKTNINDNTSGQTPTFSLLSAQNTNKSFLNRRIPTPAPIVEVLTYQEALSIYKDRRIQLDERCQATPFNITYKNGTEIMIDNRSGFDRTINLGGVFTIEKYGFKIVKLYSDVLPKTLLLDCDSQENPAEIIIQK